LRRSSANDHLEPEEVREREAIQSVLKGRPWNPCDWRGLGAIFPDAKRGDGWFEGVQQWWRRLGVEFGFAADYECGEVNAAGETRLNRIRGCRFSDISSNK
jgi:hypothetical protein